MSVENRFEVFRIENANIVTNLMQMYWVYSTEPKYHEFALHKHLSLHDL